MPRVGAMELNNNTRDMGGDGEDMSFEPLEPTAGRDAPRPLSAEEQAAAAAAAAKRETQLVDRLLEQIEELTRNGESFFARVEDAFHTPFTSAEAAGQLRTLRTELAALEAELHTEGLDLLQLAPAEQLLPGSEAMQAVQAQQRQTDEEMRAVAEGALACVRALDHAAATARSTTARSTR